MKANRRVAAGWMLVGLVLMAPTMPTAWAQRKPFEKLELDLRGSVAPPSDFYLVGPDAKTSIHPEAEGLRITLPAGRKDTKPVGILSTRPIVGDFDIRASYEILKSDPVLKGSGVGFEMWLRTATPTEEAISLFRVQRVKGEEVFSSVRLTTENGKRDYIRTMASATGPAGSLRLRRWGSEIVCFVREEGESDYRILSRHELGKEDVQMLRIGAYAGNQPYLIDVRLKDVMVLSGAALPAESIQDVLARTKSANSDLNPQPVLPKQAVDSVTQGGASTPAPGDTTANKTEQSKAPATSSTSWLDMSLLGLTAVAVLFAACWLVWRTRKRLRSVADQECDESADADDAEIDETDETPAQASAFTALSCSGCRKRFRVKSVLAGKRVKCSGCGKVLRVP